MAYYLKGLSEIRNITAEHVKLITPEQTYEEDMYFMVVMNGRSAGGFRKLSPETEINDDKLDVVLFREMPLIEMGPLLFDVMHGRHSENKNVLTFSTNKLRIESDSDIATDIDGEKGEKFPLEFSILHNRLQIFTKEDDV
jgi:diacylglycerol kinase family enzyme